jgi:hypothetical protein
LRITDSADTDSADTKRAFLEAEAEGKKPCVLSTMDYEEAQAFAEAIYWCED